MTKEQALAKIKEIISKDGHFKDGKIKVTFSDKKGAGSRGDKMA